MFVPLSIATLQWRFLCNANKRLSKTHSIRLKKLTSLAHDPWFGRCNKRTTTFSPELRVYHCYLHLPSFQSVIPCQQVRNKKQHDRMNDLYKSSNLPDPSQHSPDCLVFPSLLSPASFEKYYVVPQDPAVPTAFSILPVRVADPNGPTASQRNEQSEQPSSSAPARVPDPASPFAYMKSHRRYSIN